MVNYINLLNRKKLQSVAR